MRQPRFTYLGVYHHCLNRGINGEAIFKADKHKTVFLDILADKVDKFHMRLIASWTTIIYVELNIIMIAHQNVSVYFQLQSFGCQ
jgi:hypothetical protein